MVLETLGAHVASRKSRATPSHTASVTSPPS
jgi:hypothetical protein